MFNIFACLFPSVERSVAFWVEEAIANCILSDSDFSRNPVVPSCGDRKQHKLLGLVTLLPSTCLEHDFRNKNFFISESGEFSGLWTNPVVK